VESALPLGVNAVYELVFDALELETINRATRIGIEAAARPGIMQITAGNYGGNLGPYHIHLHQLFESAS
jgi:formylmethanofuran--tetrahydromethanopterin N-formyltransferase